MRGGEPAAGGDERVDDLADRARLAGEPLGERLAVDQLHRDVVATVRGADLVDGDDVRVREPRHRARLAQQALARVARAVDRSAAP